MSTQLMKCDRDLPFMYREIQPPESVAREYGKIPAKISQRLWQLWFFPSVESAKEIADKAL